MIALDFLDYVETGFPFCWCQCDDDNLTLGGVIFRDGIFRYDTYFFSDYDKAMSSIFRLFGFKSEVYLIKECSCTSFGRLVHARNSSFLRCLSV